MYFSKPKSFLISLFILFIVLNILYIYSYNMLVQKKSWGNHSYKNFLIENIKSSPRIIIDGGSNAIYSIDSNLIEKEFNKTVINISDNARYPLEYKLSRIEKNAIEGDIIILALEYLHYSYRYIPKNFYNNIFGSLSFYYYNLSFQDKIKLIYQTPLTSIIYAYKGQHQKLNRTKEFIKKFQNKDRGDKIAKFKTQLTPHAKKHTCQEYIFKDQIRYGFKISDIFKDNIKKIKELEKDKKIKFFITYPAVAGDNCYTTQYSKDFKEFNNKIKNILEENNITLLGNYQDSYFKKEYQYNTYYHIIEKARKIRTKRLIKSLREILTSKEVSI